MNTIEKNKDQKIDRDQKIIKFIDLLLEDTIKTFNKLVKKVDNNEYYEFENYFCYMLPIIKNLESIIFLLKLLSESRIENQKYNNEKIYLDSLIKCLNNLMYKKHSETFYKYKTIWWNGSRELEWSKNIPIFINIDCGINFIQLILDCLDEIWKSK